MSGATAPRAGEPPILPGYEIEHELGRGGFGVVWKARRALPSGIEKPVAVKMLRPNVQDAAGLARRLRDEARMLARVHHRAIVQVEDLLTLPQGPAVVVEFVDGVDLRELLARGPLPPRVAAELLAEVASALEAAHAGVADGAGRRVPLVHRDLKPGNLRVTRWGEVKLLDFGSARADMIDRESATALYALGSPDYVAPEVEQGDVTPAADLYPLGVVAWECLSGERMGRLARTRASHIDQVARALRRVRDPAWRELCAALLTWDAPARPDAGDARERLEALAEGAEGPSLRSWAAERVDPGAAGGARAEWSTAPAGRSGGPARSSPAADVVGEPMRSPPPSSSPPSVAPSGRRPGPWWMAAAAGGIVGGLAAVLFVALVVAAVWFGAVP